MNPKGQ